MGVTGASPTSLVAGDVGPVDHYGILGTGLERIQHAGHTEEEIATCDCGIAAQATCGACISPKKDGTALTASDVLWPIASKFVDNGRNLFRHAPR